MDTDEHDQEFERLNYELNMRKKLVEKKEELRKRKQEIENELSVGIKAMKSVKSTLGSLANTAAPLHRELQVNLTLVCISRAFFSCL